MSNNFIIKKNIFGSMIQFKIKDRILNVLEFNKYNDDIELKYPSLKKCNSIHLNDSICTSIYFDKNKFDESVILQETTTLDNTTIDTLCFKNFKVLNELKSGETPSNIKKMLSQNDDSKRSSSYEVYCKCKELSLNSSCYFSIRYIEEKTVIYNENYNNNELIDNNKYFDFNKKDFNVLKQNKKYKNGKIDRYFWISICILKDDIENPLPVIYGVKLPLSVILSNKEFKNYG